MRRIPMLEELPWGCGDHPDATKPLSAFESITAICNDCGHSKVLGREDLVALGAVPSFGTLWRHAFCSPCRESGASASRENITLHGVLTGQKPHRDEKPLKPIFTDDRSDPTPGLPRRNIFNRKMPELERIKA